MQKGKIIELRTGDGKLILSLHVIEKEVDFDKRKEAPTGAKPQTNQENRKGNGQGNNTGNGELMSEAQRRYLFRILADQGIEGENAYAHLKNLFGISNIKEASKHEASRVISQLLEQGGNGDGPPF